MADEQHEVVEDGDPNDLQAPEPVMEHDTDGSQPAGSVVEPESDGPTPSELGIEQFLGDDDGAVETNSGRSDAGGDCKLPGWDLERELEKILQDDDDEIQPFLDEIMAEPPPAPPPAVAAMD